MSSYNRLIKLTLTLILSLNLYALNSKNDTFKESLYILMAIDAELNKHYIQSALLYENIFHKTKKYEYLKKAIVLYSLKHQVKKVKKLTYDNIDNFPKYKESLMQGYILATIELKEYENALIVAKKLLKLYNNAKNYSIVGDIYYKLKSYNHAVTYYESSYASEQNIDTLLPLVDTLYSYLGKKKKALSYLETFYRDNGCEAKVCVRLFRYYQQEQNLDGIISILTALYNTYKTTYATKEISRIVTLLTQYLEKKDIYKAIDFLEINKSDEPKLLTLYAKIGEKRKSLQLVRKMYRKTKQKVLLGQIAILEFELATDKKKVMKHVIANFEIAIKVAPNATFQNYYGYLLIDYDLDVKKGLKLVKEALKAYPNNLAFKDSVAWGNFKNNNCKEAYRYMKEVVDEVGLNDEEIKLHWIEIQECNK